MTNGIDKLLTENDSLMIGMYLHPLTDKVEHSIIANYSELKFIKNCGGAFQ